MLNKYKNGFLELITENGFSPGDFEASEVDKDGTFRLTLSNTPLSFVCHQLPDDFNRFVCRFTLFRPDFKQGIKPGTGSIEISEVYATFVIWLTNEVKKYLQEYQYPDLWQQLQEPDDFVSGKAITEEELQLFTTEEKAQIRVTIETFKISVIQEFNPSESELAIIEDRLNYLSQALDRLNRIDWKGIAISSVLSISIALSLDTAKGKILIDLLKQAFSAVLKLLQ